MCDRRERECWVEHILLCLVGYSGGLVVICVFLGLVLVGGLKLGYFTPVVVSSCSGQLNIVWLYIG